MKILAIVGSYRKGGSSDSAVEEILAGAREAGANTGKIYLVDKHLEYCTNCRNCTQQPGEEPGRCLMEDDMSGLLAEIETADALVLASPVNVGTVTAVMKTFLERLVCCVYWPWGQPSPRPRRRTQNKRAVLVISSAAPALLTRWLTCTAKVLKEGATILGGRPVGTLFIGLAAREPRQKLSDRLCRKSRKLGRKLATA